MRLLAAMSKFFRKNWFAIFGILILCGISFGAGWWVNERSGGPYEALTETAYRAIAGGSIFNPLSEQELSYAAVRGMLGAINDPYAELIEPQATKNFMNTFSGQTGVVGLYMENQAGQVVITIVYPNGAAEQAGIKVGDIVLEIDGKALDRASDSSETGLMLRGSVGSTVKIKTRRDGQDREYELVRKEQVFVTSEMLPDGIAYLSLMAYNQTAAKQMKTALETLLAQNPSGMIWDLRNNEGGDMQACQEILSYFVKDGLLFTAQLTHGQTVEFRAKGGPLAGEIPLVVLVDHTTYSAAETSAAAIAETGRGTTVGSTTYGKGVIQATIPLVNETMLQMTVAKWLSTNGEWYHEKGVPAQVEALDDPATEVDEVLQAGVERLRSSGEDQ